MFWKRWSPACRCIVGGMLFYNVMLLALMIVRPGSRHTFEVASDLMQAGPALFATLCAFACARRAGLTRLDRQGWRLLGVSNLAWTLGEFVWSAYEIKSIEVPTPSWGDVFWIAQYPLLFAGILRLFGATPVAGRTRLLLDSAIAASSAGTLAWYFLVARLWQASDISLLGKVISCAYPLGDIGALFCAVVLVSASTSRPALRRAIMSLAAGIASLAVADSLFTAFNLTDSYHTGLWFDYMWPLGATLMAFSALLVLWSKGQAQDAAPSDSSFDTPALPKISPLRALRVLIPYVAAGSAFAIVAVVDFRLNRHISTLVFLQGLGLIGLVIARQVFTLVENQRLTAHLQNFNENLEGRIARRTAELTALHALTEAVNTTLDRERVLHAAVCHTRAALSADTVAIWLRAPELSPSEFSPPLLCALDGANDFPALLAALGAQAPETPVALISQPSQSASGLRAPLRWQGQTVGGIGAVRADGAFGPTDAALLESIGLAVGAALENARQYSLAVEAADRDSVTGLLNHRALHGRLEREWERAKKQENEGDESGALAAVMIDLNNFKLFNDTYGHPAGDQVLREVADALRAEFAPGDILGRYGGDEFLVLLPGRSAPQAMEAARLLRERMHHTGFRQGSDERTIPISLSFGIAAFPEDVQNRHELLLRADANLYAAKNSDAGIVGTTDMQRANSGLRADNSSGVLEAMVTAVDNKDSYTRRHSEDVTEYALWIAEELGLSEDTQRVIRIGGLLHDVGKIGVPGEILQKPGRLTPEEYEVLKRHPHLGALIVSAVPDMQGIVDAVRSHHERWDGQGYPDLLAGADIPFLGRIIAVADAVSAMTTDRPYRQGMAWSAAMAEVERHLGTQFDPDLGRAFLRAARRRRPAEVAVLSLAA